eukprot:gb/GEZN01001573.1/.p1 GENE.gb/GEZN01001573.1/~~gb/GEZN01001573.1/.p1  ORF type:complete len:774 (-),score=133.10 gb/GEZN01001573.1/:640-2934(-)
MLYSFYGSPDAEEEGSPLLPYASHRSQRYNKALQPGVIMAGILMFSIIILYVCTSPSWTRHEDIDVYLADPVGDEYRNTSKEAAAAKLIQSFMDPSADPCQDFAQWACGGFYQNTLPKGDLGRFGMAEMIAEKAQNVLLDIIVNYQTQANNNETLTPSQRRLVTFWQSCQDTAAIDALGTQPIDLLLKQIEQARSVDDILAIAATMHRQSKKQEGRQAVIVYTRPLFDWGIERNSKQPSERQLAIWSDGLGLPDLKYYRDKAYANVLKEYGSHIARMLALSGLSEEEAQQQARLVLALEHQLVKLKDQDTDDSGADNDDDDSGTLSLTELAQKTPGINWQVYLDALFAGSHETTPSRISLDHKYFRKLGYVLQAAGHGKLRAYMRFHLVHSNARFLSSPFRNEDFAFFSVVVAGASSGQVERWRECVRMADSNLPDDLGREFMQEFFPPAVRLRANAILEDIEVAFGQILREDGQNTGGWLDHRSQHEALKKLNMVTNRVGGPEVYDSYNGISLSPTNYLSNALMLRAHQSARLLGELRHDTYVWAMSPPSVNAFYNSDCNEMVFPGGIMQPPYWGMSQAQAYNFGAVGVMMGHELGHAFDSNGRQYDGTGKYRQWMEKSSIKEYDRKSKCVADLFSSFSEAGMLLDGKLTLDENLADISGLKTSYYAYQNRRASLDAAALEKEDEMIGLVSTRLSPEQLFFLAYGQSWCEVDTPAYSRRSVTEVHAPARVRITGPISQSAEFAEAFNCPVGAPMNPKHKCVVW